MVACSKKLSLNHSISYALKNALGAFFYLVRAACNDF